MDMNKIKAIRNMDDKIKKIALSYKRGIRTEREAWKSITEAYEDAGLACTLGDAEYILEYFVSLV